MKNQILLPTLFLFVLLLLSNGLLAQCNYCIGGKTLVELRKETTIPYPLLSVNLLHLPRLISTYGLEAKKQQMPTMKEPLKFPKSGCYEDMAFFCRLEVKLENAVKFPIKFRLGDVQYVDRLEGKY
ncbi:MAG: hypothetical protein DHS20C18_20090 [Saprospiraceae bacterium]|nr:MAG: hypothetical protein DHS20C18_20090 [Saprospiraceae bacterium]